MNKTSVFILPLLFLLSCGGGQITPAAVDGDADSITVVDELDAGEGVDSSRICRDSAFCDELARNMKVMTDAQREARLAESSFWQEDTLSREQYVVLFNYLTDHQSDGKAELIADFMYEHFNSSESFSHFDAYFRLNPDSAILESLTFDLISAWSNENEDISESDFKSKYRYLHKKGCVKYLKTLMALEN